MGKIGWLEIILIAVLVLILFGHAKIPELAKNLASSVNIFKKELKSGKETSDKRQETSKKSSVKKTIAKKAPSKKSAKK